MSDLLSLGGFSWFVFGKHSGVEIFNLFPFSVVQSLRPLLQGSTADITR